MDTFYKFIYSMHNLLCKDNIRIINHKNHYPLYEQLQSENFFSDNTYLIRETPVGT